MGLPFYVLCNTFDVCGLLLASSPGSPPPPPPPPPCVCSDETYGGGEPGTLSHMSRHIDIMVITNLSGTSQLECADCCTAEKVTWQYRYPWIAVQFSISYLLVPDCPVTRICPWGLMSGIYMVWLRLVTLGSMHQNNSSYCTWEMWTITLVLLMFRDVDTSVPWHHVQKRTRLPLFPSPPYVLSPHVQGGAWERGYSLAL